MAALTAHRPSANPMKSGKIRLNHSTCLFMSLPHVTLRARNGVPIPDRCCYQAITLRTPAHQIAWDGIAIFQSYSVGQPGHLGTATRALCLRDSVVNQSPTAAPAFRPACRATLLALSESDHDVADAQEHSRKPLREMPSGGSRERDAIAVKISDLHPENHLAERRLVGGAQHESFVEPGAEEHQHQHDTATEQMQAQTEWKATHNSCQPAQTENHTDRPRHRAHDDPIDDEGHDSNPESSISNCCGPAGRVETSHNRRRSNRCSRAPGGGNGIQGVATAAAELRLNRIRRATLIAIESCIHGGHHEKGRERCKPESSFLTSKTAMIVYPSRLTGSLLPQSARSRIPEPYLNL